MGPADTKYTRIAQEKLKRQEHHREAASFKMCHSTERETQVTSTESEDDIDQDSTDTKQDHDYTAPNETAQSNTLRLTNPRYITGNAVAATLDRCNISNEAASQQRELCLLDSILEDI